jgi:hypothetical protein
LYSHGHVITLKKSYVIFKKAILSRNICATSASVFLRHNFRNHEIF